MPRTRRDPLEGGLDDSKEFARKQELADLKAAIAAILAGRQQQQQAGGAIQPSVAPVPSMLEKHQVARQQEQTAMSDLFKRFGADPRIQAAAMSGGNFGINPMTGQALTGQQLFQAPVQRWFGGTDTPNFWDKAAWIIGGKPFYGNPAASAAPVTTTGFGLSSAPSMFGYGSMPSFTGSAPMQSTLGSNWYSNLMGSIPMSFGG